MSQSPLRPVPSVMNPDSDEDPLLLPLPLLNLSDEVIPSTRGIPMHTRYTRRNQVLIARFRKLVYIEVLANLHIKLNQDVMDVIEAYTFERTHPFVPHEKTEHRRSLLREEDILDLLTPCKEDTNTSPWEDDVVMHCLIGRVLYGFDIHDSRYGTVNDPNPCEIMTDDGGIYLVPDKMSNWFLYQDGNCIALPTLFRFKHYISDARVISRKSGPFLRIEIKPVNIIIPGTDDVLRDAEVNSPIWVDDSDLDSLASYEIDQHLLKEYNSARSHNDNEDSLAAEIENCWKSTRESVLVVINPQTEEEDEEIEPLTDEEEDFDEGKTDDEFNRSELLKRPVSNNRSEDFVNSYTTSQGLSLTSAGSANFHSAAAESDRESVMREQLSKEEEIPHRTSRHRDKMRKRPSILTDSDSKTSIVLELGAGFIGKQYMSQSILHKMTTPNPHSWFSTDSSLECMELEAITV